MCLQADAPDEEADYDLTAEASSPAQEHASDGVHAQVLVAVSCIISCCLAAKIHLTNGLRLRMATTWSEWMCLHAFATRKASS